MGPANDGRGGESSMPASGGGYGMSAVGAAVFAMIANAGGHWSFGYSYGYADAIAFGNSVLSARAVTTVLESAAAD
jgi:hypothetical protein